MIDIRRFERANLKRIVEIERGSFGKEAWPAKAFVEYWRNSPELFLVARYGRRIAGYSIARIDWRGAELDSIAVDARFRGLGIARALLKATVRQLRSRRVATLRLMVGTTNEDALHLYRSFGFVRKRLVRRYYGAGRDAWRMALKTAGSRPNQKTNEKAQPDSR